MSEPFSGKSNQQRNDDPLRTLAAVQPSDRFERRYERLLQRYPFHSGLLGQENPYTGRCFESEADYRAFLREAAYAELLSEQAEGARKKAAADENRCKRLRAESENLLQQLEATRTQCTLAETQAQRAVHGRKSLHALYLILILALLLCLLYAADRRARASFTRGYAAAKAFFQPDAAPSDQPDRFVPNDSPERAATDGEAESGPAPSEPAAEQTFIGNVNSHVFHRPSCTGLPAEKNRVLFSSREDALDSGYTPCGRCNP